MMTQITFEGLIDEVTGVKFGSVPWVQAKGQHRAPWRRPQPRRRSRAPDRGAERLVPRKSACESGPAPSPRFSRLAAQTPSGRARRPALLAARARGPPRVLRPGRAPPGARCSTAPTPFTASSATFPSTWPSCGALRTGRQLHQSTLGTVHAMRQPHGPPRALRLPRGLTCSCGSRCLLTTAAATTSSAAATGRAGCSSTRRRRGASTASWVARTSASSKTTSRACPSSPFWTGARRCRARPADLETDVCHTGGRFGAAPAAARPD
jgi:hypothetical protein